jgi:hypothetical protein
VILIVIHYHQNPSDSKIISIMVVITTNNNNSTMSLHNQMYNKRADDTQSHLNPNALATVPGRQGEAMHLKQKGFERGRRQACNHWDMWLALE